MSTFQSYRQYLILLASTSLYKFVQSQQFSTDDSWVQYPRLSASCLAALNNTIDCDVTLTIADSPSGEYLDDDQLTSLCSDTCITSLSDYKYALSESCLTSDIISNGEVKYMAVYQADYYLSTLSIACRTDSDTGKFCSSFFLAWSNETLSSMEECSDCFLGTQQLQLDSPFHYGPKLASQFESTTTSCQNTNFPYTSPTLRLISSAKGTIDTTSTVTTITATPSSCATPYLIAEGDSCTSISLAQNVSTFSLLVSNNLGAYCYNFPTTGSICLPPQCNIHTVVEGQTCSDLVAAVADNISINDLRNWNANINIACDNLDQLVGTQICIGAPVGSNIISASTSGVTPVSSTTSFVAATGLSSASYWASDATYSMTAVIPMASGSMLNCTNTVQYMKFPVSPTWNETERAGVQSLEDNYNSCASVARRQSIRVKDLLDQNPILALTSPGCKLKEGYRYCADATTPSKTIRPSASTTSSADWDTMPTLQGTTEDCTGWAYITSADEYPCTLLVENLHISVDQLYSMNTWVKSDCSGLYAYNDIWETLPLCVRIGGT